jgi:hypothetical protein
MTEFSRLKDEMRSHCLQAVEWLESADRDTQNRGSAMLVGMIALSPPEVQKIIAKDLAKIVEHLVDATELN